MQLSLLSFFSSILTSPPSHFFFFRCSSVRGFFSSSSLCRLLAFFFLSRSLHQNPHETNSSKAMLLQCARLPLPRPYFDARENLFFFVLSVYFSSSFTPTISRKHWIWSRKKIDRRTKTPTDRFAFITFISIIIY